MTREETIKWLESLKAEIGKSEHRTLWHYAEALNIAIEALSTDRPITSGYIADDKEAPPYTTTSAVSAEHKHCWNCKHYEPKYNVCHAPEVVKQVISKSEPSETHEIRTERHDSDLVYRPSAEAVQGEWLWRGFNIECSLCGNMPTFDSTEDLPNYCPNCGARMEASK